MTASLPLFAVFFTGALLVALAPARLQKGLLLFVPMAAGLQLLGMPEDHAIVFTVMGYELMPYRVDRLSLLFGYIFTLAAFIGIVFSLHLRDRLQHASALVYAGSALGAVFAGDLITLFVFWELTAISSVFL
ncbi:MAG: Na(+)/H(+) antiporter subunit D, partial [Pseudomonadota bacterium]